jgi:hypothetical protein
MGEVRQLAELDLSKRALRRFLAVGNGKEAPENTEIRRFYTAWTRSCRSALVKEAHAFIRKLTTLSKATVEIANVDLKLVPVRI